MHTQHQKKKEKEEQKGFDALEASFIEKGLVAAGSTRSMGLKAIGEIHAHQDRHQFLEKERERKHEAESKTKSAINHVHDAKMKMARLANLVPVKIKPKYGHMPQQLKKPDVEDPEKGKKR